MMDAGRGPALAGSCITNNICILVSCSADHISKMKLKLVYKFTVSFENKNNQASHH